MGNCCSARESSIEASTWTASQLTSKHGFNFLEETDCDSKYKNYAEVEGNLSLTKSKLLVFC